MGAKHYTPLQIQWIIENFEKCESYKELHNKFTETFGQGRTIRSLQDLCSRRLNLHKSNPSGQYGNRIKEQLPIGTERIVQGTVYVKVLDVPQGTKFSGYAPPYWLPKQRKIYEDAHGQIPNGHFVVFLDSNKTNYNIDNLYCLGRNIHSTMCKKRWYTTDKNITLTAIKYLELLQALKCRVGEIAE